MADNLYVLWRRRRHLKAIRKHLRHTLHVEDDILTGEQKRKLEDMLIELESVALEDGGRIDRMIGEMPGRIQECLGRKKSRLLREYVDVIAVAVMVAFGIRGLFLQPFQIPTGSMQPTLFGIHYVRSGVFARLPVPLEKILWGADRAEAQVRTDGYLDPGSLRAVRAFPWGSRTVFNIGGEQYRLPGEPDKVREYCALTDRYRYNAGEVLCNGWLVSGDHLFVDRFSHHLVGLRRGDVIVFNTEDIYHDGAPLVDRGYYYIKRLIGMPGDTIRLQKNMIHIRPRGEKEYRPIVEFNPAFEKLYAFKGGYHGHLNVPGQILGDSDSIFTVPEDSYFTLGDNSASSLDSRYWGIVPRKNIVGKGFWVFWPLSRRWGAVDSRAPLPVRTNPRGGFPAMTLQ